MEGRDHLLRAVGVVLRAARQHLAISQEELAARAGLHRTYVSQLERGLKSPSLTKMADLSNALDMTLPAFVARVVDESERL